MRAAFVFVLALAAAPFVSSNDVVLETDLSAISRSWGQISTYADNAPDYFGVLNVGLPDGCQVEQAHLLQRHAQRFPTSTYPATGGIAGRHS